MEKITTTIALIFCFLACMILIPTVSHTPNHDKNKDHDAAFYHHDFSFGGEKDDDYYGSFTDDDNMLFWQLDTNEDGVVDALELLNAISRKKPLASEQEVIQDLEELLKLADRNRDNGISFLEFELMPQDVRTQFDALEKV